MLACDSFKIYGFRSSQEIMGKKPNEGHFTPIKAFLKNSRLKLSFKGPFILLCRIISVECPANFDPHFMLIGCLGLPLF